MPTMPKPSEQTKDRFRALLPEDPRVQAKPMFGQLAGFVNGHMFTGIFGDSIFVRPSDADRATLMGKHSAQVFAPMAGRPMKDYVVLPDGWLHDPKRDKDVRTWITRSLETTAELPPKAAKPAKAPKKTAATKR
jgi:TfoX/Sxy family transcriptional regulator of competence genes